MSLTLSLVVLTAALDAPAAVDPFANAAPDWSFCEQPRDADKTCKELSRVEKLGQQSYRVRSEYFLDEMPYIVAVTDTLTFADGQFCSLLTLDRFRKATFRRADRALNQRENAEAAASLQGKMRGLREGMKVCASFVEDGGDYLVSVEVSGQPKAGYAVLTRKLDYRSRWVHDTEGFTVRRD